MVRGPVCRGLPQPAPPPPAPSSPAAPLPYTGTYTVHTTHMHRPHTLTPHTHTHAQASPDAKCVPALRDVVWRSAAPASPGSSGSRAQQGPRYGLVACILSDTSSIQVRTAPPPSICKYVT